MRVKCLCRLSYGRYIHVLLQEVDDRLKPAAVRVHFSKSRLKSQAPASMMINVSVSCWQVSLHLLYQGIVPRTQSESEDPAEISGLGVANLPKAKSSSLHASLFLPTPDTDEGEVPMDFEGVNESRTNRSQATCGLSS